LRGSHEMRIVHVRLDEVPLAAVDRAVKRLGTTRSAFAREALRMALGRIKIREMERKHREGYLRKPVRKGEFGVWEPEHAWGD
jgi:metal-responsive CopG/Arc/MetJ family transcriptional regulator